MALTFRKSFIPKGNRNRPGYAFVGGRAASITVHNTANPDATAANHVTYLNATDRAVSWHITVDDKEAVMHIPLTEQAWHAGCDAGNTTSLGIEVCEFTDPARHAAAENNAEELIAKMLTGTAPEGWNPSRPEIQNVVPHKYWTGKICPRTILPHWAQFKDDIKARMSPSLPVYYVAWEHMRDYEVPLAKTSAAQRGNTIRFYKTTAGSWQSWPPSEV